MLSSLLVIQWRYFPSYIEFHFLVILLFINPYLNKEPEQLRLEQNWVNAIIYNLQSKRRCLPKFCLAYEDLLHPG